MSTSGGGGEDDAVEQEHFASWELVWAKAAAKGDWWPCQKCEVPDERYQIDLTGQIKLESDEHCVYCFGSLNYAKIKPGMIAKFEKNFEQFSKECKKKSFLKAMEEVERYKKGTFPGAPGPRPAVVKKEEKDAEKPRKEDKDKTHKKQKVESKTDDSDSSSSSDQGSDDSSSDSSSDDEETEITKKRKKQSKVMAALSSAKRAPNEVAHEPSMPKKPMSAYNRFCKEHLDRIKDKYPDLTPPERRVKLSEVWEEMEGSDERRRLEQQFASEMVDWKKHADDKKSDAVSKQKKSSVGGRDSMGCAKVEEGSEKSRAEVKGKEKGDVKVKEDPERKALLHKLSALSASLTTSVEELGKLHRAQSRILAVLSQPPLPITPDAKQSFLEQLKNSQVGKAVQRVKKHPAKEIKDAANNLRCMWESLIDKPPAVAPATPLPSGGAPEASETLSPRGGSSPLHATKKGIDGDSNSESVGNKDGARDEKEGDGKTLK